MYPHQYNPANDNLDISGGVNEYTDSTIGERATYDENGNVLTYTDSFGKTAVNTYDSEPSKLGYSYFHVLHIDLGQFTRNYTQTTKRGLLTTNKG